MRDSIVFYRSFYEAIKDADYADQVAAFHAIMEYGLNDTAIECSGLAKAVLTLAKPQIEKNNKRYENGSKGGRPTNKTKDEQKQMRDDRNSQEYVNWRNSVYKRDSYQCVLCGSKEEIQAHHIKSFADNETLRFDVNNGKTLCRKCHEFIHSKTISKPNLTKLEPNSVLSQPNVNVNDNVNDNDKDKESTKRKRFVPPTLENVIEYCREKALVVDAQRFIDFYESKGWMVGKNKMKDWKAACRNWSRSNKKTDEKVTKSNNMASRSYDMDSLEEALINAR